MDDGEILWAIGLVAATIFGWLAKITHMLTNLAERYVPRTEINRRFDKAHEEFKDDVREMEKRSDTHFQDMRDDFKTLGGKVDRVLDKLDGKADK